MNDEMLSVYGGGLNVRKWIYVEDNCVALGVAPREGDTDEVHNVGSDVELPNLETTEKTLETVGSSEDQIESAEDHAGRDQRYAIDATKTEALGWRPGWSFEDGPEAYADYYLGDNEQMANQRNQTNKPIMRISDDEWEAIAANVPLVSVDLIIRHEDGVPPGSREDEPAHGEWFVSGGTVFKSETLMDALYRITDEELGAGVVIELRFGTFGYFYDTSGIEGIDSKRYLVTAFEVMPDDDDFEMDIQHSQLRVSGSPYESLHPYVRQYLDALD